MGVEAVPSSHSPPGLGVSGAMPAAAGRPVPLSSSGVVVLDEVVLQNCCDNVWAHERRTSGKDEIGGE